MQDTSIFADPAGSVAQSVLDRSLIVICWDGKGAPLEYVNRDCTAEFDLLVFDFSGSSAHTPEILSHKCAGKGEVIERTYVWLNSRLQPYRYVSVIDHDIEISFSQINTLLAIGNANGLHSFAPALSRDSYYSFRHLLEHPGSEVRPVDFVEIMFPFYDAQLFLYCARNFGGTVTAYGMDEFAIPASQKILGLEKTAVIDSVVARHLRPVASHKRSYANGLSAYQERGLTRRLAMVRIALERSELVGTRWYFDTFARWNSLARYWPMRLLAPAYFLRRLFRTMFDNPSVATP